MIEAATAADLAAVTRQLGRTPRGVAGVAWRCHDGVPGVVATLPVLPDGTPFPTTYYLTCPRVSSAVSTLESSGLMAEMTARLDEDEALAAAYRRAHDAYIADRDALARAAGLDAGRLAGISAGGMPTRVKCLHALVAHALGAGPGVNPLGDEAVAALGDVRTGHCLPEEN